MTREYIMQVQIDDDGHEYDMTRKEEIVRCKNCKHAVMTYDGDCKYCEIWFPDEAWYMSGDYYCGSGERKQ